MTFRPSDLPPTGAPAAVPAAGAPTPLGVSALAPVVVPLRPVLPAMTARRWSLLIGGIVLVVILSSVPYSDTLHLPNGDALTTTEILQITLADALRWLLMIYPVFWIADRTLDGWRHFSPAVVRTAALLLSFWPVGILSYLPSAILLPARLHRTGTLAEQLHRSTTLSWLGETCLLWGVTLAIHVFLQRLQRSQDALVRASELQVAVAEARLAALSSELQPHFLFNTLNGIAELVMQDPERAERMVLDLSSLLHLTLRDLGQRTVDMETELARVERYVALQQVRFADRLSLQQRIDSAALGAAVPPMLLQPIIENAIRHGIERRSEPGTIVLTVERANEALRVVVQDSGPGPGASTARGSGMGLSHTRARLAAVFGAAATLTLAAGSGGGTVVTISAPFVPYAGRGGDA